MIGAVPTGVEAGISSAFYLTGLGALLSLVYMFGIVFRPRRTIARMGLDSAVVLVLYVVGMAGLVAIATAS